MKRAALFLIAFLGIAPASFGYDHLKTTEGEEAKRLFEEILSRPGQHWLDTGYDSDSNYTPGQAAMVCGHELGEDTKSLWACCYVEAYKLDGGNPNKFKNDAKDYYCNFDQL